MSIDDWTRYPGTDTPVDWRSPRHYRRGVVTLVLDGEDPLTIGDAELSRRRDEFMKLTRRELKRTKKNGPASKTRRGR